jgi:hypothetical protein
MAPILDFANHCHTNLLNACAATNIAFVPVPSRPNKTGSASDRDGNSDAGLPFLPSHSPFAVQSGEASAARVPWQMRSLRIVSPGSLGGIAASKSEGSENEEPRSEDKWIAKGDEILFPYGGHDDGVLFAEYGFVPRPLGHTTDTGELEGNPHAAVIADDLMEELWSKVDNDVRRAKLDLLGMQGYLGYVKCIRDTPFELAYTQCGCLMITVTTLSTHIPHQHNLPSD